MSENSKSREELIQRKNSLEKELEAIYATLNQHNIPLPSIKPEKNYQQLKNNYQALEESGNKFRSIIENMELGLIELDTHGVIRKAYPSFCKMYGYSADELEGTRGIPLLPPEGIEKFKQEQEKRLKGQSNVYEFQLIPKNGERKWVLISGTPIMDKNGKINGSIAIHLDITERKKMESELVQAKEIAEKALHVKEVFLANISHEMRTPVHAITGLSDYLFGTPLNEEQLSVLNNIKAASGHLIQLIDDLLILTRSGINEITLQPERRNLLQLLNSVLNLFIPQKKDEIELLQEINIPEESYYLVDELRLTQIIINLLSNANKFTQSGYIRVSASISEFSDTIDKFHLKIEDTGIGIPKNSLQNIFEAFNKGENNQNNKYEGSGLGLSIVKKLSELMGGTIKISSSESGTIFSLTLQLQKTDFKKQKTDNSHLEYLPGDLKILAAEDNPINQLILSKILSKYNAKLTLCENGVQAVEQLKNEDFDIVLMDIKMPVMNGDEAIQIIRNELELKRIPIIVLTANTTESDRDHYINLGANEFLTKPFEENQLIQLINKSLNGLI